MYFKKNKQSTIFKFFEGTCFYRSRNYKTKDEPKNILADL